MKLQELISPKRIAGTELILSGTGYEIYLTILKKDKSSIITESSKEGITSVEQLATHLPEKIAVYLSINGKGIIHKKLSPDPNDNDKNYLQAIFPNANPGDFYIQKTNTDDEQVFVSVIRKQTLDELLAQLKDKGIQAIDCYLGPFAINSVAALLNKEELNFQNHQLKFYDNAISDYQSLDALHEEPVTIGDETIKSSLLLSFATAFSYFLPSQSVSNNIESVATDKEEFKQKSLFEFSKWAMAIFFFVVFLANFFVFKHFLEKKNRLTTQLSVHQGNLDRYESLKRELGAKDSLIEKLGISKNSKTSYYSDQIALDMPSSILLNKLNVHPALKKNNPGEESFFEFKTESIHIEGSCSKSIEVNDWIKSIQQKKWVKEVEMSNYTQNKETGRGDFVLEVRKK